MLVVVWWRFQWEGGLSVHAIIFFLFSFVYSFFLKLAIPSFLVCCMIQFWAKWTVFILIFVVHFLFAILHSNYIILVIALIYSPLNCTKGHWFYQIVTLDPQKYWKYDPNHCFLDQNVTLDKLLSKVEQSDGSIYFFLF